MSIGAYNPARAGVKLAAGAGRLARAPAGRAIHAQPTSGRFSSVCHVAGSGLAPGSVT